MFGVGRDSTEESSFHFHLSFLNMHLTYKYAFDLQMHMYQHIYTLLQEEWHVFNLGRKVR